MNLFIPVAFIAIAGMYIQQTWGYDDFESVKFPYTIAIALIVLSVAIFATELRKRVRSSGPVTVATDHGARRLNPLFLVLLTVAFAAALPVVKTIAALYFYVLGLRLVFRNLTLASTLIDAALIVVIYLIFHDVLLILLPAGPLEETLSAMLRQAMN